ncbi:MAG: FAD-dependent oxidoreductase [Deltaproteobacteria bacterium]|jgi:pyruvate/2-oxoglutarate dehydrogenase complex dihydrolipoamide dehydrogenase (E3) component|nr:FAD-dependent oxidoreductase [Deltaproteobacteria bacterium]
MATYDFDLGVIGGGAAGLTISAGASQLGAKTLLVEKEKALGGDCLHYGCVPSKTLIRTARAYHEMKHAAKFGLPQVDVQPVDFRDVARRIRSVIDIIQQHDSVERFCSLGARVEFGQPEFIDEHTIRLNSETFSARTWTVATGSSPAIPPFEGIDSVSYLTNKDIFYLDKLPGSMIILGGGPIAIEMAQAFNRLGTRVTVVQRSAQILSKEDRDLADAVMEQLRGEGVLFALGSTVVAVAEKEGAKEVTLKNSQGEKQKIEAETLLVATGRKPNVEGLGLENAGVSYSSRGIEVDSRLRTNRKHIFAAGDITGRYQFTHAAGYEGGIVVSNAIFHLPRKADYTFLPWCTYTSPELASIGLNEKRAAAAGIAYSVWTEEFRNNDRSLAEGEETGRIKMLLDEKEKVIGVQILGPHGGDLLSEWVAVLNGKVKLSTLAGAVHPYPTLGEINKRVAGSFLSGKIFSDTVKKGLKLFFNFKGRACEESGK